MCLRQFFSSSSFTYLSSALVSVTSFFCPMETHLLKHHSVIVFCIGILFSFGEDFFLILYHLFFSPAIKMSVLRTCTKWPDTCGACLYTT